MRRKAFLQYQWKEIRIAVLILGIMLLFGVLNMISVSDSSDIRDSDLMNNLLYLGNVSAGVNTLLYLGNVSAGVKTFSYAAYFISVVFAFSLFGIYGNTGKMDLFRSFPYTRREIWWRSYFMGSGILTMGYLVFALAAAIFYVGYWPTAHDAYLFSPAYEIFCSLDTLGNGLLYILEDWLITLGVFSLAVFARMAMGHVISALLVLAGLLTGPYLLLMDLSYRVMLQGNKMVHGNWALVDGVSYLADRLLVTTSHVENVFNDSTSYSYYDSAWGSVNIKYSTYEWSTIALWAGIVLAVSFFAYRMSKKDTAFSVVGRTPFVENLFIFCAGFYPAILVMLSSTDSVKGSLPVMLAVFLVIEGIMIHFFKRKRPGRYEKWNTWRGGDV